MNDLWLTPSGRAATLTFVNDEVGTRWLAAEPIREHEFVHPDLRDLARGLMGYREAVHMVRVHVGGYGRNPNDPRTFLASWVENVAPAEMLICRQKRQYAVAWNWGPEWFDVPPAYLTEVRAPIVIAACLSDWARRSKAYAAARHNHEHARGLDAELIAATTCAQCERGEFEVPHTEATAQAGAWPEFVNLDGSVRARCVECQAIIPDHSPARVRLCRACADVDAVYEKHYPRSLGYPARTANGVPLADMRRFAVPFGDPDETAP